ncbi:MAG TPA: hypothetical protein QF353_04085 [Gammaproteobacteria bacterium]|nr:hypothetical protein [Gammaproteobacteria bacterium]
MKCHTRSLSHTKELMQNYLNRNKVSIDTKKWNAQGLDYDPTGRILWPQHSSKFIKNNPPPLSTTTPSSNESLQPKTTKHTQPKWNFDPKISRDCFGIRL